MAIATPILSQFNAGEFSPLMEGRVDTAGYFASLRLMQNMIPTTWGPALMRPGSRFINEVQTSDDDSALVPFVYSNLQAYMFEAAANYLIPYKNKGRIEAAATDAVITNGTFAAGIGGWDDRSSGFGSIAYDAANARLSLIPGGGAAADIGWAEQAVTVGAGFKDIEHVMVFDVAAAAGDRVEVQIGTTSTGAEILGPVERAVGGHTIGFTPGATTFYVQFRNLGSVRDKTVAIDNVSLINAAPVKIPSPYAAADVQGLRWEQSYDVLYLNHPNYGRRRLERYGHTTWSLLEYDFEDGPYLKQNKTATTLTAATATGLGITLSASAAIGINSDSGFKATDVGRLFRFKNGASPWGWGVIVGWTSATVVTVDIRSTLTTATATAVWRLGLYCDTDGHAKTGEFHEQRSVLTGAAGGPDRTDFSATDDFPKFAPGVNDDDAFTGVLASSGANPINWLVSAKVLLAGSGADVADQRPAVVRGPGIFRIGAAGATAPLTPANAQAKPEGVRVLAMARSARRLLEIKYNFGEDGYIANDRTIRAAHIADTGLDRLSFQPSPWSTCWTVRGDGQIAGFVFEPAEKVDAWARHVLGGSFNGGGAVVEDTAVIPGPAEDEVWLLVKRTINGVTRRYIEVLEERFTDATAQEDAFFVDCGLTMDNPITITGASQANPVVLSLPVGHGLVADDPLIASDFIGMTELNGNSYTVKNAGATTIELYSSDGSATVDGTAFAAYISGGVVNKKVTTVSGLPHLEGETVKILGDGAVQADRTVVGGGVTLANAAGVIQIGLGYTWILQPQRLEAGARLGTAQITPKQINNLRARLWRSGAFFSGPDVDNLAAVTFGPPPLGKATALFSGDKTLPFDSVTNTSGDMYLTGTSPAPVGIIALVMDVVTVQP